MIIIGTGVDIVEVMRVADINKKSGFKARFYGEFEKTDGNDEHIAGMFAAKEAFSKALGTGIRGFKLSELNVLNDEMGRPYYLLTGNAHELSKDMCFELSISHTKEYAVAFVIAFKK